MAVDWRGRKIPGDHVCVQCSKTYRLRKNRPTQRYCSPKCAHDAMRVRRPFPLQTLLDRVPYTVLWNRLSLQIEGTNKSRLDHSKDGLTYVQADEMACAAGYHPCEIWGDLWWSES